MKARRESAARSLKTMMAGTIVLPLAFFCYTSWQNYNSTSLLADERIARSLEIAVEQARKVFQSIEVVFSSIDEITLGRTDEKLRLDEAELSERLKLMAAASQDIRSIWLFNLKGT